VFRRKKAAVGHDDEARAALDRLADLTVRLEDTTQQLADLVTDLRTDDEPDR
jgi:hypothetical protein